MHFSDRLAKTIQQKNSCLMLGLDPNWEKIPNGFKEGFGESFEDKAKVYENFCLEVLNTCSDHICGVKPQLAYFEALGSSGIAALEKITRKARDMDLIVLADAKRGDIGSTCEAYAQCFLGSGGPLESDALTVNPFMGSDSVVPFTQIQGSEKGVIVLLQTSNQSAFELQQSVREVLTDSIKTWGDFKSDCGYSNVGVVVGATHPSELVTLREKLPNVWMLCPGVGAQGGKIEDVLKIRDQDGLGVLIPVSRSVLYAGNKDDEKTDYLSASAEAMKTLWESQKV